METPSNGIQARELLLPGCADVYEAQLKRIWWALIRMRESMHIVSSIVKFPLRKFVAPHDIGFFWSFLVHNCGDSVVLTLHSLINDNEKGTLSLRKLANSVRKWLRPQYVDWYQVRLKEAKFDARLDAIAARVRDMRHATAHMFLNEDGIPTEANGGISESEAEEIYVATKQLFRTACLTAEFVIDQRDYRVGNPEPHPIDRLLDLVAKDSHWITMPESRKEWWPLHRQRMTEEELKDLNEWRARFKLPPA